MKRFLHDARLRWFFLAGLWTTVLVLGVGGFLQQGRDGGQDRPFLDTLYLTLQLATLDYDGSSGSMNWRLQIGRFVTPILAASTVIQTATTVFAREFDRFRLRYAKDHTVVVGLGEIGSRIAHAYLAAGHRVVVVDADAALVESVRAAGDGPEVLAGDPTDPAVLRIAGVHKASRVVVATGVDLSNVEVLEAIGVAVGGRSGKALRVAVELSDSDLAMALRAQDLSGEGALRVSYVNLHERAARALLAEHRPGVSGPDAGPPRPMVVGLGRFGRSVVLALAQRWAEDNPGIRLPIVVVDKTAAGRWGSMVLQHPALAEVCEPIAIDLDLDDPDGAAVGPLDDLLSTDPPTWVAIVVDTESSALANAVFLHHRLSGSGVPITVRMRSMAGLGSLLSPRPGAPSAFPGVEVFPFLERTCTVASLDGGIREQLAEAVHQDYLSGLPASSAGSELARPWNDLDDDQRDQSRRRVDGIVADLASIGCDLVPLRHWGAPSLRLTADEEDALAAREHQRWFDDRTAAGWTWGPTRDPERKQNPLLVPWADLDVDSQVSNLKAVQQLPALLARAGLEAFRRPQGSPDPTDPTDPTRDS